MGPLANTGKNWINSRWYNSGGYAGGAAVRGGSLTAPKISDMKVYVGTTYNVYLPEFCSRTTTNTGFTYQLRDMNENIVSGWLTFNTGTR